MLRHWIYREHYFKDLQGSDFDHMASHAGERFAGRSRFISLT